MFCIKCGHKGKETEGTNPRLCSHCGHQAVADASKDGLSDKGLKAIVDRVSLYGEVFFLKRHVAYGIQRLFNHRYNNAKAWLIGASTVLICTLIFGILYAMVGVFWVTAVAGVVVIVQFLRVSGRRTVRFELVDEFFEVNSHDALVTDPASATRRFLAQSDKELRVLLGRILVCEQKDFVSFLLMNKFPLNHACPVIGPGGDADPVFPDLVSDSKNKKLDVFILHNYTPHGTMFASNVVNSPEWFGEHADAHFIDIGLRKVQTEQMGNLMMPLSSIPDAGQKNAQKGGELTMIRPKLMLTTLGQCLEERCPIDKLSDQTGDYDKGHGGVE